MSYMLTIYISDYIKVGDDYQRVEVKSPLKLSSWDDVQNTLGYLVEGRDGYALKFELKVVKGDAE